MTTPKVPETSDNVRDPVSKPATSDPTTAPQRASFRLTPFRRRLLEALTKRYAWAVGELCEELERNPVIVVDALMWLVRAKLAYWTGRCGSDILLYRIKARKAAGKVLR